MESIEAIGIVAGILATLSAAAWKVAVYLIDRYDALQEKRMIKNNISALRSKQQARTEIEYLLNELTDECNKVLILRVHNGTEISSTSPLFLTVIEETAPKFSREGVENFIDLKGSYQSFPIDMYYKQMVSNLMDQEVLRVDANKTKSAFLRDALIDQRIDHTYVVWLGTVAEGFVYMSLHYTTDNEWTADDRNKTRISAEKLRQIYNLK